MDEKTAIREAWGVNNHLTQAMACLVRTIMELEGESSDEAERAKGELLVLRAALAACEYQVARAVFSVEKAAE